MIFCVTVHNALCMRL